MNKILIYILIVLTMSSADIYFAKNEMIPIKASILIAFLILAIYTILFFTQKTPVLLKNIARGEKYIFFYFFLLSIVFIAFLILPGAYWETEYYPFLTLFSTIYLVFIFKMGGLLKPSEIKVLVLSSFMILFVTTIIDLFFPASFSFLATRGAGIAENPNSAALRMIFIGIVIIQLLNSELKVKIFLLILSVGILSTLSRGGLIFLAIVFFGVSINGYSKKIEIKFLDVIKKSIYGIIILGVMFFALQEASQYSNMIPAFNNSTSLKRINMLLNRSDFIPKDETRLRVAGEYIDLIYNSPFLGYGTGHSYDRRDTYNESTHIMYLTLLIDFGIVGLLIYILIIFSSLRYFFKSNNYLGVLFSVVWFLGSFYSNTILTNRTLLCSLALLLIINDQNKKQMHSIKRHQ